MNEQLSKQEDSHMSLLRELILAENQITEGDLKTCIEEYFEIAQNKDNSVALGFTSIDGAIGGLRYGDLFLVMGRTAVGKTWVLLNVLKSFNKTKNVPIGFFSLEMSRASIIERLMQLQFGLSRNDVFLKAQSKDESFFDLLSSLEHTMLFSGSYSIEDIRKKVLNCELKVVFIDFLGLLKGKNLGTVYEKTTAAIADLKNLATNENVLVIVAHQLSRLAEDGAIPVRLHMARDSGSVEELSDFVLGLYRPEIASEVTEAKGKMFLSLLKNKRGETITTKCGFDSKSGLIFDIDSGVTNRH